MLPILPLLLLLLFPGAMPVRADVGAAGPSYEVRLLALAVASARQERAAEEDAKAPLPREIAAEASAPRPAKVAQGASKPSRDRDGPKV